MKIFKRVLIVILVLVSVSSVTALAKPNILGNVNIAGIGRNDWIKELSKDNDIAKELKFSSRDFTYNRLAFNYYVDKEFITNAYDYPNDSLEYNIDFGKAGMSANFFIVDLEDYYKATKEDFVSSQFYKDFLNDEDSFSYLLEGKIYGIYAYDSSIDENFNASGFTPVDYTPLTSKEGYKALEKSIQFYQVFGKVNGLILKENYTGVNKFKISIIENKVTAETESSSSVE